MPASTRWAVVVGGVGAVGSAVLRRLGRLGVPALGLDRFHPPHDRGSSHGDTRITRLALGEGEPYLPLARRSHQIWRELEAETGRSLFGAVGCLVYGPATGRTTTHGAQDFLATTLDVARRHGLRHEALDAAALARRFPQFRFRGDESGCLEPDAGFVRPEACIAALLESARKGPVAVHPGETLLRWSEGPDSVEVVTDRHRYETDRLILTTGAWLPSHVPALAPRARVCRQVLHWFEPDGPHAEFGPDRMPVFIRVADREDGMFYGFPALDGPGGGLKIAGEQFERTGDPDAVDPAVAPEESAALHALAAPHLRLTSRCVRAVVCKYTVLPRFRFVIDRVPGTRRVWMASACSGHGFKHSAGVGEALADLAVEGRSSLDVEPFRDIPTLPSS